MLPKLIPLQEIDKAIRINCVIDNHALKALTLKKHHGVNNKGVGRGLFIYVAVKCGYAKEEICDYLAITEQEFDQRTAALEGYYTQGKLLFDTIGASADYHETANTYVFFYRKLVLVNNYLRYKYNEFIIEKAPPTDGA